MPALLPIVLAASHLVLAAELGAEIRRRANVPAGGRGWGVAGARLGRVSAGRSGCARQARAGLGPIQRGTEEPVRRICRTRSRTELRGVAHLPGNGKAGTRTSARLESGNRGPQVTVSSSFRVDYRGWRTSPASATACMPIAVWACPYRPLASFFPSPNASDLSP